MSLPARLSAGCPFCSCFCTDVDAAEAPSGRARLLTGCPAAQAGLDQLSRWPNSAQISGFEVSWDEAFDRAASLIRAAHSPLILLTGEASCEAQAAASRLGCRLNACVDTPASAQDSAWTWATASASLATCTLGDLRGKALLFWGTEPARSHPRFWERFVAPSQSALAAVNSRLPVGEKPLPEGSLGLILELRRKIQNMKTETILTPDSPLPNLGEGPGVRAYDSTLLLNFLSSASDGVILFGADPAGRVCLSELLGLCMDLENCGLGRWEVLPLLEGSNTAGAAQTLLAECGFPASVRFTSQEAEYSAQEWSAENLLERGETDLVIWAGAESWLSPAALEKMNVIPSIVLSCQPPAWTPAAWLRVARFGIESRGTALRLDGIPISLEAPFQNAAAEMASVLARLEEAA